MKEVHSILRVLVVDDHMMMRTMVSQHLEKLGFTDIETANNGQEAIKKIQLAAERGNPYHILMLDWHMPVMEGIDLLKTCRQNKRYNSMAIIMLTAEKEERNVLQALKAGATSYLVKPVAFDALKKNIDKTLTWLEQQGVNFGAQEASKKHTGQTTIDLSEAMRERLEPVISVGLRNIFSELFHVEIVASDFDDTQGAKDMVCVGNLYQDNMTLALRFFFNQKLLEPLLRQIYSSEFLEKDETFADAACEIVNILCAQVKAFLNKNGYDLEIGLPETAKNNSGQGKNADSYLNISFSLSEDDNFYVDLNPAE